MDLFEQMQKDIETRRKIDRIMYEQVWYGGEQSDVPEDLFWKWYDAEEADDIEYHEIYKECEDWLTENKML